MTQDGGKVVSLMDRPLLHPGNTPGTHFRYRLSRPQGHSAIGRIMSMKKSNDTIWNRTRALPICNTVPEPLSYHGPRNARSCTKKLITIQIPIFVIKEYEMYLSTWKSI